MDIPDWTSDDEDESKEKFLWDQRGTTLGRWAPKEWNLYPWEKNLNVMNVGNQLEKFDNKFSFDNQNAMFRKIQKLTEKLGLTDNQRKSLEQIVILYKKKSRQYYDSNNGWIEIVIPFILIKLPPGIIYNLFEAIQNRYIIKNTSYVDNALRRLLFYHDPELALFFKKSEVSFDNFCIKWIKTLLAGVCHYQTTIAIWKWYFNPEGRKKDRLFILFLIIAIIIKNREKILRKKNQENGDVILNPFLTILPKSINPEDVDSICLLAEYYKLNTPNSTQKEFLKYFFDDVHSMPSADEFPCLDVLPSDVIIETHEVLANQPLQPIRYIIVDCRSSRKFNAGHLPTAVNLDYTLYYRNPSLFANKIDNLIQDKEEKEPGNYASDIHLCFMDNGYEEEENYLVRIIVSIIKAHVKHVSILKYGYAGVHDECDEDTFGCKLIDHNRKRCSICNPKLLEKDFKNIGKKQKILKRMKSTLKCINMTPSDDDDDDDDSVGTSICPKEEFSFRIVDIEAYKKKFVILGTCKCLQINLLNEEEYESLLIFTKYDIILLRIVKNHSHAAYVTDIRRYSALFEIHARREELNLWTLRYGEKVDGEKKIIARFRVRISSEYNKSEIIEIITKQCKEDALRLLAKSNDQ